MGRPLLDVNRPLVLVPALSTVIGYAKASAIAPRAVMVGRTGTAR